MLLCLVYATLIAPGSTSAQERFLPMTMAPTISFGMIGLGNGATARLNVVNLVRTPPPVAIPQAPCKLELDLYDNQGKLLQQKNIANLGYGQADFVEVLRSDIASTAAHVELTGAVKVGSSQSFFCNVSATLEIFDNVTGTTTAILTGISAGSPLIFSTFPFSAQPAETN
ncbi:MAG TPA: hypothetical protein VLN48_09880 [Bryobacteraceae bacterium]|nr:hypothetical protein [Bryobacteraceae bacterium]